MTPEDCSAPAAPGFLSNRVARLFNRAMDVALRPHGISLAYLTPLMLLDRDGPMLQADLVKRSATAQPAMAAALSKLEGLALVKRTRVPDDNRAASVSLTAKGRSIVRAAGPLLVAANDTALEGFTPQETTELVRLMGKLIDNLERSAG